MLLGDVWAVIATIVGIAVCAWALLLCFSFFFVRRTGAAKDLIVKSPVKMILMGLGATLVLGGTGTVLTNLPFAGAKLLGMVMLLGLFAISFTGSAGLVQIVGERIHELDSRLSAYGAMSRGAMFIVLSCIFPVLGWLLMTPIILCLGVGAGLRVMRLKESVPPIATTV